MLGNGRCDHIPNHRPRIRATISSLQTLCGPNRTESCHCLLRAAAIVAATFARWKITELQKKPPIALGKAYTWSVEIEAQTLCEDF